MEFWNDLNWEAIVKGSVAILVIVVAALFVWMALSRALGLVEQRSTLPKTLILPIRLVVRYGLMLLTTLLVITSLGIPIGNFWTLVSTILGLIAIGFVAVWSMLSNVSATFFLLIFQPFRVGDYVRLVGDEAKGVVIDINFMYTTVRSLNGDVFKVPNNLFFQKSILRPINPEAGEKAAADAASRGEAKAPDHSQANLEGIKMPTPGRGPK